MWTPLPLERLAATLSPALATALATALVSAALVGVAGCTPISPLPSPSASPGVSPGVGASPARQQLDGLTVAAARSMGGYSRDRFRHWSSQGDGCDTRDRVLQRDGTGVTTSSHCKVTGGTWFSPYDNKQVTDPIAIDIDHLVPLANAWRSGANDWSDDQRSQFANDLTRPQLIATTATVNRSKGDQDPAQWKPPNRGYWCEYARRWTAVKAHWRLTVTAAEKGALIDMLTSCQSRPSALPTSSPVPAGS